MADHKQSQSQRDWDPAFPIFILMASPGPQQKRAFAALALSGGATGDARREERIPAAGDGRPDAMNYQIPADELAVRWAGPGGQVAFAGQEPDGTELWAVTLALQEEDAGRRNGNAVAGLAGMT